MSCDHCRSRKLSQPAPKQWQVWANQMAPSVMKLPSREDNPAYAPLSRVELGQTPLALRLLRLELHPQGDADGRTATLVLNAEPKDSQLIAPLEIKVNVSGPLDQLVKLGMNDRVNLGGR